jgi:protein-disulfide isomerase
MTYHNRGRIIAIIVLILGALLIVAAAAWQFWPRNNIAAQVTPITPIDRPQPKGLSVGDPNAPVKLDVWEDFQCSACLYFTKNIEPGILDQYVSTGKVYFTFHNYPFIDGDQGESHDAANAAMCAAAQNRFWDYHDMLFANWLGENAGSYTRPRLVAFAEKLGLDMNAFNKCFSDNAYAAEIQKDVDAGKKLGVPPTPGIFVNGKAVQSSAGGDYMPSYNDVAQAIDAALGK